MPLKALSLKVWQDPTYFLAFGFGSGLMPIAPGTWGTLAALPIYLLLRPLSLSIYLLVVLFFTLVGVMVSNRVVKDLGIEDYKGIVCDEMVGYLLTMACAPRGFGWLILGFLLFRLFDIWKPFPINKVDEHVKGGMGIMLDDVLAAVPAWLLLQTLAWILK